MAQFWAHVGLHCVQHRGRFDFVLACEDAEGQEKVVGGEYLGDGGLVRMPKGKQQICSVHNV